MKTLLAFCFLLFSVAALAQKDAVEPAYKRYPTIPALQLLLGDSTTVFKKEGLPKGKPTLVMLFSPECSHCNHSADEMNSMKDSLQGIQIVLATLHPLWQMNEFVQKHKLNDWKNIVVGKDIYYILPGFYEIKNLPFMAMYDKKGNLISVFEGSLPMRKVLQILEGK
jgi:thioredoxin-related protein